MNIETKWLKNKRILKWVVILGVFCAFKIFGIVDSYVPFDSAKWKSFDPSVSYPLSFIGYDSRSRQLRRLERQQPLIGLNRQQLNDLLGPSDGEESTFVWAVYSLVDDRYVAFEFENEKVVGYQIRQRHAQMFEPD